MELPPRKRSSRLAKPSHTSSTSTQINNTPEPHPSLHDIVGLFSSKTSQPQKNSPLTPAAPFPSTCVVEAWLMMPNTARREYLISQLAEVYNSYVMNCPRSHQLLTVTLMNVHRAFVSNMLTLGLSWEYMQYDSVSPFSMANPGIEPSILPESLRPTPRQRSQPHHAWVDLFPCPVMRNNLLSAGEEWDDDGLCIDIMGFWKGGSTSPFGLIVWGDPSNPDDWEFTEGFLEKWGWTLRGCNELIRATNRWREKRGERALFASRFLVSSKRGNG